MSTIEITEKKSASKLFKEFLGVSVLHWVMALICFSMTIPFVWMLLTSLKTTDETNMSTWIPQVFQWNNYKRVFDFIPFARFYWNSLLVASWVTFLQVLTCSMAAFSFSRIKWKGRDKVFMLYLGTLMLPGLVMMIPNYQIMIALRLVDTLTGLILPSAFCAMGTFLMRQFMLSIPSSLDEAAEIDGASKWQLFWDVILPLCRPGIVTLTIFTFLGNYASLFWPLVMLKSEYNYTLPIGMLSFNSSRGTETALLMAASAMMIVPLIIIFVVMQKQLVKGIQLGAVKG